MRFLGVAFILILIAFGLSAQTKPMPCSEMIGDLYIQAAQQQREQRLQISELSQQLAAAQAELAKLKADREPQ